MPFEITEQEYAAVLALPGDKRYEYFIKHVADWEEVWTLKAADGFILAGDDHGREYVPVWPHPRYAEACAAGAWEHARPTLIELEAWLERWLPGMAGDGRQVAVFPVPTGKDVAVTPQRLADDLNEELAQYG